MLLTTPPQAPALGDSPGAVPAQFAYPHGDVQARAARALRLLIAVRLTAEAGLPVLAHVLPLGGGEARSRPDVETVAAVFINPSADDDADVRAMSIGFGLTRAETAVLAQFLSGQTHANAAEHPGIAMSTTKTHLSSIFHKTGTARQMDLILLAARISPAPL